MNESAMEQPKSTGPGVSGAVQRLIALHLALIGLAGFLPIPFVDDYLKARVQRRLVQKLAEAHGVTLSPKDVATIANAKSSWKGRFWGIALLPARAIFKKAFLVLGIKGIVDSVSIGWHRAFLIDFALGTHRLGVAGAPSPAAVRAAIDAVCKEVPVTPVEPALRAAFEGGREAIGKLGAVLARALGKAGSEAAVDAALDETADDVAAPGIVERILRAFSEVPEAHRDRLRSSFERHLPPQT